MLLRHCTSHECFQAPQLALDKHTLVQVRPTAPYLSHPPTGRLGPNIGLHNPKLPRGTSTWLPHSSIDAELVHMHFSTGRQIIPRNPKTAARTTVQAPQTRPAQQPGSTSVPQACAARKQGIRHATCTPTPTVMLRDGPPQEVSCLRDSGPPERRPRAKSNACHQTMDASQQCTRV